eukprot:gene7397-524_t
MEYGMRNHGTFNTAPEGQGVEWYTPTSYGAGAGAAAGGGSYAAPGYGSMSTTNQSYGANPFDDEPPLLEELGIDIAGILMKTRSVLFHRLNSKSLEDLDMGGALIFIFVLGGLHLLTGKLHFGIILGWSVVHSAVLWFVINQLAGTDAVENQGLDLYSICCVCGYCMVPLVVYSAISLLVPQTPAMVALAAFCTLWSAHTAARIFGRRSRALDENQWLVMYPCILMYGAFSLLCIY